MADKRQAILLALKAWPERNPNEVAAQIGCSRQYVAKVEAEQVATGCILPRKSTPGRDGKSYPATRLFCA